MEVNGTLINYFFHCKRQCYLHANRLNLEDNSERVKIGRAIHEEKKDKQPNTELAIDHIKMDRLTSKYLIEIKKSDADVEASRWQVLFYLKILKDKGIIREGKLEFIEKNKQVKSTIYVTLDQEKEEQLMEYIEEIKKLVLQEEVPEVLGKPACKKCAYYEYCYI